MVENRRQPIEREWQIALGAAVLVLMLLAGAFSLGVYIGRHGLSREGLRLQGPGAAQPGPLAPQGPGAGQPGALGPQGDIPAFGAEQPQVVGRVRAVSSESLELATQQGPRLVSLSPETRLEDAQGARLEWTDLRPGAIAAVFGEFSAEGGGRQLLAERVVLLPERPQGQP